MTPILMTYTKLLPHLIHNSLIVTVPLKPIQPPHPKSYDPNARYEHHVGTIGHTTERFLGLKHKVQDLIDIRWLSFKENGPNVGGPFRVPTLTLVADSVSSVESKPRADSDSRCQSRPIFSDPSRHQDRLRSSDFEHMETYYGLGMGLLIKGLLGLPVSSKYDQAL
ncbi:hypothetical protein CR513_51717, partial [Mucuna pruriens]